MMRFYNCDGSQYFCFRNTTNLNISLNNTQHYIKNILVKYTAEYIDLFTQIDVNERSNLKQYVI